MNLKVHSMTLKVTKTMLWKGSFCLSCFLIYSPFSLKQPRDVFISILKLLYLPHSRGPLLNSKYVLHNACVDFPFPFREGGGNGVVPHYAHENGCSTYLLLISASQEPGTKDAFWWKNIQSCNWWYRDTEHRYCKL